MNSLLIDVEGTESKLDKSIWIWRLESILLGVLLISSIPESNKVVEIDISNLFSDSTKFCLALPTYNKVVSKTSRANLLALRSPNSAFPDNKHIDIINVFIIDKCIYFW